MAIFHEFYLVHSWIVCPICYYYVEVIFHLVYSLQLLYGPISLPEKVYVPSMALKKPWYVWLILLSLFTVIFVEQLSSLTCVSVRPRTCRLYANVSSIMFLCLLFSQQSCTLSVSKFKVLTFTIDFNICSSFQKRHVMQSALTLG